MIYQYIILQNSMQYMPIGTTGLNDRLKLENWPLEARNDKLTFSGQVPDNRILLDSGACYVILE